MRKNAFWLRAGQVLRSVAEDELVKSVAVELDLDDLQIPALHVPKLHFALFRNADSFPYSASRGDPLGEPNW